MRPLLPQETGMVPKLNSLPGIAAVVFDIYGTLIISAAGDIGIEAGDGGENALSESSSISAEFGVSRGFLAGLFQNTIKRHQAERCLHGVAFPKVEIRAVWVEMLESLGVTVTGPEMVEELALRYECEVNPVWPMPHAAEVIRTIAQSGRSLGIVSNAQFYTRPVVEGLFDGTLDDLGFHPELQVFSYEIREGKPSLRLYEILAECAGGLGIAPEQIFYLGNDMTKDVLPARDLGFRTGLFAGDARSLRLGGFSQEEASHTADAVITDLAQLPALFHIPA